MSDLQARLDQIAERGAPRGFDAVFDAAVRESGETSTETARDEAREIHDTQEAHEAEVIPFVTAEERRVRPRRRYHSLVSAAGLSAMLLVGLLAISAVVGSGGANSPEGAVRRLADALRDEDALQASDVLAPSELARLHGTLDQASRRAAELELVKNAGSPFSGLDLGVDDLELSVQELADGYAKVTIENGTLTAETKKAKFSPLLQKALRESGDNRSDIELASLIDGAPTFVMAVREDGKWYVSAAYTALEYVRVLNQATAPVEYGAGRAAAATLGADSPEAAADGALRSFVANDWERLSAFAAPGELPLYDYRKVLAEITADTGWFSEATLDSGSSTVVRRDGDTAYVEMHYKGTTPDGPWSLDGGCLTRPMNYLLPSDPSAMSTSCIDGKTLAADGWANFLSFGMYGNASGPRAPQLVRVVRQDGRWFVSPAGTALDVIDDAIAQVDRDTLLNSWLYLPQEVAPEGALTLGETRPVDSGSRSHVFTFEGRAGQTIIPLGGSLADAEQWLAAGGYGATSPFPLPIAVFAPDGSDLTSRPSPLAPVTLPADGTYRVVVANNYIYGAAIGSSQLGGGVTVWDAADAPETVRKLSEQWGVTSSSECVPAPCATTDPGSFGCSPSFAADGTIDPGTCARVGGSGTLPLVAGDPYCVYTDGGDRVCGDGNVFYEERADGTRFSPPSPETLAATRGAPAGSTGGPAPIPAPAAGG